MSSTSYWGGRVVHEVVPTYAPGTAPSDPSRRRLMLPQGELALLHNSEDPICYLAWIELKPGVLRGNHYHRVKREHLYLIQGTARVCLLDLETQERLELQINAGDLILIEPGIAHVIESQESSHAVEYSPVPMDIGDTYRHVVV